MDGTVLFFSEELEYQFVKPQAALSGTLPEELDYSGFQCYTGITGLEHAHR